MPYELRTLSTAGAIRLPSTGTTEIGRPHGRPPKYAVDLWSTYDRPPGLAQTSNSPGPPWVRDMADRLQHEKEA